MFRGLGQEKEAGPFQMVKYNKWSLTSLYWKKSSGVHRIFKVSIIVLDCSIVNNADEDVF